VVVFFVLGEHFVEEGEFAVRNVAERVDDGVPVVPDLVVFEVREGRGVEPGDFVVEVVVESEEGAGSVDPVVVVSAFSLNSLPTLLLLRTLVYVSSVAKGPVMPREGILTRLYSAPDSS
jgi:hypothetical protein